MELVTTTLTIGDLPQGAFESVKRRLSWMEQIEESPKVMATCEAIASNERCSSGSVYRLYNKWKKDGKSWESLIDRRFMSKTWARETRVDLPAAFIGHFRLLCEENQRSSKAAHRRLLQQLEDWRSGKGDPIPGYDFPPDNREGKDFPAGWGYKNLMSQKPTDVQLAAARLGRSAAKQLLPSVRTTRVNLYPFAEIQFDDMWHDFLVNVVGQQEARRLLEFGAIDYYSGFIFPPGLKPRITDSETQQNKLLNMGDFRLYLAYILTQFGYHPRGTVLNVENGTAAISRELEEYLRIATNGLVRVVRSGMSGSSPIPSGYGERPKGNFRVKSIKEGMGNLIHNETAFLPGNVGKDRDHLPAENWGRARENKQLLAVASGKPDLAEKLQFGFLNLQEAREMLHALYDRLNNRYDHKLEGFVEAGLTVNEIRLTSAMEQWMSPSDLNRLPEQERFAISAMVRADNRLRRSRLMKPREVLESEREQLIRMPSSSLPHLLGENAGKIKVVRQLQFHLEGEDIGGERKFIAEMIGKAGLPVQIPNGTKCRVFINPFMPDRLIVADPDTNEFLGECAEHKRVDRGDLDAIRRQAGQMERVFRDAIAETGVRASRSKIERQGHNARVIRDACNGEERIKGLDSSALLTEDRHEEPELTENTQLEGSQLL